MPSFRARCCALCLVAITTACAFEPEPEELTQEVGSVSLTNPGFESDFSGWTEVEPTAISSVAHGGSRSAKMRGKTGQVKRVVGGLTPATTYQLSAWLLGSARLGARSFGGAEVSTSVSAKAWTQKSVTFSTGASSTSVEIFAAWRSGGDARVDDFTLVATSEPPPPVDDSELTPGASGVVASTSDANLAAYAVDGSLSTRWSGQ